jgi:serine phosphatase RsbU (regulator of sigma subunit)
VHWGHFYAQEQQLLAVKNLVKAKAAASKKVSKLAERLVKEQAKVEHKYEHHLLKQINNLKRQLLDVKLRNVQYEFVKAEQMGYYFEKVMRAQKDKLQQLQSALLQYTLLL